MMMTGGKEKEEEETCRVSKPQNVDPGGGWSLLFSTQRSTCICIYIHTLFNLLLLYLLIRAAGHKHTHTRIAPSGRLGNHAWVFYNDKKLSAFSDLEEGEEKRTRNDPLTFFFRQGERI